LEKNELPKGWEERELGESTTKIKKGIFDLSPENYVETGIPFLRISNIQKNLIDISNCKFISTEKNDEFPSTQFGPNDIVLAKVGGSHGGKVAVIPESIKKCNLSQNMIGIKTNPIFLEPKFLFYFLQNSKISNSLLSQTTGTSQKMVRLNVLKYWKMSIPPLNEQKRIVSKIEELFSKLESNEKLYQINKEKIPTLRQAIFKKAFSGDYSVSWRKYHKKSVSTEELQSSILVLVSKYKKKISSKFLDKVKLLDLPLTWYYLSLDSLTSKIVDGTHFSPTFIDHGISFISAKDINSGKINFENCKFISKKEHEELTQRCNPEYGDVLMSKSGTIGRTAVVDTKESFSLCESAALIKPLSQFTSPKYLSWFLEYYVKLHILNQGLRGVGVRHFQLIDIKNIPVPICVIEEQIEIVKRIESELNLLEHLLSQTDYLIAQNTVNKQSILKQAFEGKLVPQDPNDEPASELVKRIKASNS